jgi:hypothetical protein
MSSAHEFSKHAGEMARVLKACFQSCVDNAELGVAEVLLGTFDSLHQDIIDRSRLLDSGISIVARKW